MHWRECKELLQPAMVEKSPHRSSKGCEFRNFKFGCTSESPVRGFVTCILWPAAKKGVVEIWLELEFSVVEARANMLRVSFLVFKGFVVGSREWKSGSPWQPVTPR